VAISILRGLFLKGEACMPYYDYYCKSCEQTFSKMLSINQHENNRVTCPHCGSRDVEQKYSAFYAVTSKKSA